MQKNITCATIFARTLLLPREALQSSYAQSIEETPEDKVDVSFLEWLGVQTASAACPSTTSPVYKQLRLDIDGGTYNNNTYNGDNDLYLVLYQG